MATVYRIHLEIGVAGVGNSPGEFFIGPEHRGELPEPQGGFKDAQCRVKRQAARFRIFAHYDDGSVEEITDAEADITWTVQLANRKAAYLGRGNSEPANDLVTDPGARSTTGSHKEILTLPLNCNTSCTLLQVNVGYWITGGSRMPRYGTNQPGQPAALF